MLKSMTGFGHSVFENNQKRVYIEIKTLNSKQLDLNIKIPVLYREKEIALRNVISQRIQRGKTDVVFFTEIKSSELSSIINEEMVKQYFMQLEKIRVESGIENFPDPLSIILRMPDVIKNSKEELCEEEWEKIESSFNLAIDELDTFRVQEGKMIEKEFITRIEYILKLLASVEKFEKLRISVIKSRIQKSFTELLNESDFDKNRFEQELLYYIEKMDISEEKARLKNHCEYFIKSMKEDASGKKLGFIAQEIGREINTLGSKANDSEIQKIVVQMKDELEKIKEQLMNVL